ncbi:HAD family phosphatase [Arthrobacter gandavensis]|uniref:HAD family hydrolase n=1 Tax=Arthrobacter gandavensis TaxID=169960 RepID=UPI00188E05EC|nr:HAD family phosphatase [Arthrobacter gandavensis]MBF4995175.1 HAD family phosphatase [Arthrobacter gandavensis]
MPLPGTPVLPDGPAPALQAVFWDLDGTIVDTEPYWIQAEKDLVREHGGIWTDEDAVELVGQALPYSARRLQQAGVSLAVDEVINALTEQVAARIRRQAPWRPGARKLLEELAAKGIPCALVTMSPGPLARLIAGQLPEGTFRLLVTGEMVDRGKPHPDPYQLAFNRLAAQEPGLSKSRCAALEDSYPGYTSALAAGLCAVAIPHITPLPANPRRIQWDTLSGRTVRDLEDLVAAWEGTAR